MIPRYVPQFIFTLSRAVLRVRPPSRRSKPRLLSFALLLTIIILTIHVLNYDEAAIESFHTHSPSLASSFWPFGALEEVLLELEERSPTEIALDGSWKEGVSVEEFNERYERRLDECREGGVCAKNADKLVR